MKSGFCLCPASWQMLLAFLRRSKAGKVLAKRIAKRSFTAGNPAGEIRLKQHRKSKRRFSPAQLRAQRKFTAMAKSGKLARLRKRRR